MPDRIKGTPPDPPNRICADANVRKLAERVYTAQKGDDVIREALICEYTPFVLKCVSSTVGHFIEQENSEEFSVGLMAFNEAIDRYEPEHAKSFLGFASLVINRRVIDYMRSNRKNSRLIPMSALNAEGGLPEQARDAMMENVEVQDEILRFNAAMDSYGLPLETLARHIPCHRDTRMLCLRMARILADNEELKDKLIRTKKLPVSMLAQEAEVYPGTVQKNRRFIIALFLMMQSGMETVKQNIELFEGEI